MKIPESNKDTKLDPLRRNELAFNQSKSVSNLRATRSKISSKNDFIPKSAIINVLNRKVS